MKRDTRTERKILNFKKAGLSTYEIAQITGKKQPNVQRVISRSKREKNKAKEKEQYLIEMSNKDVS